MLTQYFTVGVISRGDTTEISLRYVLAQRHLPDDFVSFTPLGATAARIAALTTGNFPAAVIDGGNPTGPGSTVNANGSVSAGGGANPATGYSLIEAASLEDALKKAKACPLLAAGGSVEVAPAMDM